MTYPFIQARQHGGTQTTVKRLVIHGTVTPCGTGWARRVAADFHTTTRDASAHYVIDPGEIVQCLTERTIGYHSPPNTGSLGFELCDPQKGSSARWRDANHEAMLRRAAGLVRARAKAWGIPLVKLTAAQLRAGHRGICGHADVTAAWHLTDHTDPGTGFPWAHFMDLVKGEAEGEDDDDMPEYVSLDLTKPQPVQAGKPARIVFSREWADTAKAHADGKYPGILSGGDHGTQFVATINAYGVAGKWRLIETDPADSYKTSKNYPYGAGFQTISGWCDKGQHLYVEFTPDTDGAVSAAAKVNYWRR